MRRSCVCLLFVTALLVPAIPALSQNHEPRTKSMWILPSVARFEGGAGGSRWTTGITVTNLTNYAQGVTFKLLGHDEDGRGGTEGSYQVDPGAVLYWGHALHQIFGIPEGYGAVRVTATSPDLIIQSETSTLLGGGYEGTVGQSVPALGPSDLAGVSPKALVPISEFEEEWTPPQPGPVRSFRTNVALANAVDFPVIAHLELFDEYGTLLASRDVPLPPLGMTQINRVASSLGVGPILTGRLAVSTLTPGGLVAAYASVIDNTTNDPRTVLPR